MLDISCIILTFYYFEYILPGVGYIFYAEQKMEAPFLSVDEAIFVVPKKGKVSINRSNFKLIFVLDGRVRHAVRGLDGTPWLKEGDILIVPDALRHVYINEDPIKAIPMQVVRLFLDAEHLRMRVKRRKRLPEQNLSDYILKYFGEVTQISGGMDNEISQILNRLRQEMNGGDIGGHHQAHALCVNLVIAVSRKLSNTVARKKESSGVNGQLMVAEAKEYIFKHFDRDLTLGEIAWHVGKGEEHLARVFKR